MEWITIPLKNLLWWIAFVMFGSILAKGIIDGDATVVHYVFFFAIMAFFTGLSYVVRPSVRLIVFIAFSAYIFLWML